MTYQFAKDFSEISFDDKYEPGTGSFFLGDTYKALKEKNVPVPDGFVISREGYEMFINQPRLKAKLSDLLSKTDKDHFSNLRETGLEARSIILNSELPEALKNEISKAKNNLIHPLHSALRLAIRCGMHQSAENFSQINNFHDIFLNISEEDELFKAFLKCYSAIFSDDEIRYRVEKGIDHFKTGISICVQKMVRSDLACSGIIFGIDPEDKQDDTIRIEGCWGMMENITYGNVIPDRFVISRSKLAENGNAVLSKKTGSKAQTLIYFDLPDRNKQPTFVNIHTQESKRNKLVLTDEELLKLARWSLIIAEHYKRKMNMIWAKDGLTHELFVVRPLFETA
jgi:pyruvate, water dikinase